MPQTGTFARRAGFPDQQPSRRSAMDTGIFGRWGVGRPEDQPLISAVLLVLIALTLYFLV
jgi:hypothetical protein